MHSQHQLKKTQEAEVLLRAGLRPQLVKLYIGSVSGRQVTSLSRVIREEGDYPQYRGDMGNSKRILKPNKTHTEAIRFLLTYLQYHPKAREGVDINQFVEAFLTYTAAALADPNVEKRELLNINLCWVLARDYRSRDPALSMVKCRSCEGVLLVHGDDIRAKCPSCKEYGAPKKPAETLAIDVPNQKTNPPTPARRTGDIVSIRSSLNA